MMAARAAPGSSLSSKYITKLKSFSKSAMNVRIIVGENRSMEGDADSVRNWLCETFSLLGWIMELFTN